MKLHFCLFVCLFFHFQPSVVVCVCFFCTNFVVSFYQHNFFCGCVFLCVPSLTVEGFLFCHISLIFVGVWQVLSFAFFSFVVFNGPKFPVYYFAFFLLVRLLFPPAPTSLTLDPRVFSFSIIVAAVKRDHLGDDVA